MSEQDETGMLYAWSDREHTARLTNDPRQDFQFLSLMSSALDDIDYDASVYVRPEQAEGLCRALLGVLSPEARERVLGDGGGIEWRASAHGERATGHTKSGAITRLVTSAGEILESEDLTIARRWVGPWVDVDAAPRTSGSGAAPIPSLNRVAPPKGVDHV